MSLQVTLHSERQTLARRMVIRMVGNKTTGRDHPAG